jgi:hypothetical protein
MHSYAPSKQVWSLRNELIHTYIQMSILLFARKEHAFSLKSGP